MRFRFPPGAAPLVALVALVAAMVLLGGCKLVGLAGGAAPDATETTPIVGPDLETALGDRLAPTLTGPTTKVHFIDVGQGDAILIESPSGKRVLVDTGPPGADDTLFAYLRGVGAESIDLLVNTHAHADHIGNTSKLLEQLTVKRVFDSGFAHPTATYEKMLDTIERTKVPLSLAKSGQRITLESGVVLTVLGPSQPHIDDSRSDPNANSVVLRLDHGDVSFILTGDAEEETEERLLAEHRQNLRATVLKVAHHGSAHATDQPFLDAVAPRLAIVSCAAQNSYGHPAPSTLRRLANSNVATLVTAELGHIVVSTDGRRLTVKHGRALPTLGNDDRLDINTADRAALIALDGIGEVLADRIIADRTRNGPFVTVSDLARVNGVGSATVEKLRPYVTVR